MCATSDMLQLHTILQSEDIEQLALSEISYLQLHFMERLEIAEIAALMEREQEEMERIAGRFRKRAYQPSARSTM